MEFILSTDKKKSFGMLDAIKEYWYVFVTIFSLFTLFFCGLVFIVPEVEFGFPPKVSIANMGVFGDSFNVLTSLFTGLAFAGLLTSIFIQRKELKLQQKELKRTKKEFIKMNILQVEQQFKNDVQRDIEGIKNGINNLSLVLNFPVYSELAIEFKKNANSNNYNQFILELFSLQSIIENHILIFYKRHNEKKNYSYAKEEIKKILSVKEINNIFQYLSFLFIEVSTNGSEKLSALKNMITVLSTLLGYPELEKNLEKIKENNEKFDMSKIKNLSQLVDIQFKVKNK